ncbi:MAG TPA: cytochrome b N-terminal domain-containing protein [Verrucomicrobiae bacterium]|nr:cytochrome b N-terminal domain-containing protein [Verrucomicrobiae bacterium]
MKVLFDWLDHRTGCRGIIRALLYENIPGGSRWRYVWGSTLTFALAVQFITGIFLWMAYSPSSHTAWESVYYIQDVMTGGWLLRGLHHYTAQAMTVLLVLHLMQVMVDGAYKAPREVNFWFGVVLLLLVLGLSLTGYLLPWDQKGYWATKVATNLMAVVPVAGPALQKIVIGGSEYGHHTLTRFFALHAGVLPAAVIALVIAHIYLFRRHGIRAKDPKRKPDEAFWPDQWLKDTVACLAVLATVLFLIVRQRLFSSHGSLGAELGAPADPSEAYSAARPEWYFLFLFQFLKYFPGTSEVWGAIIIPSLVLLLVFLMPVIGRWRLGHRFNLGLLASLLAGTALLTWLAVAEDRNNRNYLEAIQLAERDTRRVRVLAQSPAGIPGEGALALLHGDPLTQGPKLFSQKCAGCHRYNGTDGLGAVPKTAQSASDLRGFASREWLAGLLDPSRIATTSYFGGTKFRDDKMVKFVQKDVAQYTPAQNGNLRKVIAALSAEAQLKDQIAADQRDEPMIQEGRILLENVMRCTECHQFHKPDDQATAPDLTGYGSRKWLINFIGNPAHPDFYGSHNDRMPAFGQDQILNAREIGLIADWLRGSWYEKVSESASQ